MDSEDGIDVSEKLAADKDAQLSLDIIQAVVGTVKVLILDELPHNSELQTLNLTLRHMEATSSIVFDDAVRINEEPDPLRQEVGRLGILGNLPESLEIALGSVPINLNLTLRHMGPPAV